MYKLKSNLKKKLIFPLLINILIIPSNKFKQKTMSSTSFNIPVEKTIASVKQLTYECKDLVIVGNLSSILKEEISQSIPNVAIWCVGGKSQCSDVDNKTHFFNLDELLIAKPDLEGNCVLVLYYPGLTWEDDCVPILKLWPVGVSIITDLSGSSGSQELRIILSLLGAKIEYFPPSQVEIAKLDTTI